MHINNGICKEESDSGLTITSQEQKGGKARCLFVTTLVVSTTYKPKSMNFQIKKYYIERRQILIRFIDRSSFPYEIRRVP